MTREDLTALMTAILYPVVVPWCENSAREPIDEAYKLACEIQDKVELLETEVPDPGEGQ